MMKRLFFLALFIATITACARHPEETSSARRASVVEPVLIDSSDIVPYFKYYVAQYESMWKEGTFVRDVVDDVGGKFLLLAEMFPDSRYADDALFMAGKLYLDMGDYEQAKTLFEEIVDRYPEETVSPLSNKEGYSFHIAPLAHLLIAQIYQYYYEDVPMAYWEYSRIHKKYAHYLDEHYLLNDTMGHVLAEAQFNMGELSGPLFGIKSSVENYQRTVLRYSGYYWENGSGVKYDYGLLALERIYEMSRENRVAADWALIFFSEMLRQHIYSPVHTTILFYRGRIEMDRGQFKKAVETFKELIYSYPVETDNDVAVSVRALEMLKDIEAMKLDYLKADTENLTEQVARTIIKGKENELLQVETLLFLGRLYFEKGDAASAQEVLGTIFKRYPYMMTLEEREATLQAASLIRDQVPIEEYKAFLKKNIFFIPEKYNAKRIFRGELKADGS
ncbi:MAG TPA: tetratricopeptide repeat protein [Candidatus Mcinerneyibacteriales bacterium]|nr:tetratricopeptide repeat protein [Candidatus Mcinerneyibacteriales bacterium]